MTLGSLFASRKADRTPYASPSWVITASILWPEPMIWVATSLALVWSQYPVVLAISLMPGYLLQNVRGGPDALVVGRVAVEAVDLDRVSALERGGDEFDVLLVPRVVIQGDVHDVGGGHGGVEGHDQDACVLGFLDDAVERVRGVGVHQDDVDALGCEVADDVRLLRGVTVGDVVHELVVGDLARGLVLLADRCSGRRS